MWKQVWVVATFDFELDGHFQGKERSKCVFRVFALIWIPIAISVQNNYCDVHIFSPNTCN